VDGGGGVGRLTLFYDYGTERCCLFAVVVCSMKGKPKIQRATEVGGCVLECNASWEFYGVLHFLFFHSTLRRQWNSFNFRFTWKKFSNCCTFVRVSPCVIQIPQTIKVGLTVSLFNDELITATNSLKSFFHRTPMSRSDIFPRRLSIYFEDNIFVTQCK
jgi:hypothetical protein